MTRRLVTNARALRGAAAATGLFVLAAGLPLQSTTAQWSDRAYFHGVATVAPAAAPDGPVGPSSGGKLDNVPRGATQLPQNRGPERTVTPGSPVEPGDDTPPVDPTPTTEATPPTPNGKGDNGEEKAS